VDVTEQSIADARRRTPHRTGSARSADDAAEREVLFVIREGERAVVTDVVVDGTDKLKREDLVAEIWSIVDQAQPDLGLLQRLDPGDVDDLLGRGSGKARPLDRPFELSDEGFELLPRPFIGKKPLYLESAFDEAGRRIADLYRSEGFLDVRVHGPTPSFSDDGRAIVVRYQVQEGPRILVAAVQFIDVRCAGDAACQQTLPFPSLLEDLTLVPGQPASFATITNARARLERNLQNVGHPFARVSEAVKRLSDAPAADVIYTVDPGPKVTIGKVRLKGNDRTQPLVILDRVTLDEGDLYSADEVEESRQRLARLGLFSLVSIELLDDDPTARTRDLLVIVKERPQFAVELGTGASVEDGPRAFLAGEVRNVAGFGVSVRGRGQVNYPRAFYDLRFDPEDPANPINRFDPEENPILDWGRFFEGQAVLGSELPKVYGMPWDTRIHIDTVVLREIRPAFTLNRGSVLVGADTQPVSWLHLGPQIEGEVSDFDCPRDLRFGQSCGGGSIGLVRRRDAGFIRQTTYRVASSVDLRDHPIRPRAGVWLSGVADLALGSGTLRTSGDALEATPVTSDFVKLTGVASGYVPLSDTFVLALTGRVGNIFPFTGAYIPLFKRFYLGGTNTIRGFREDEILPADDTAWPASSRLPLEAKDIALVDSRQSLGGNFLLNARTELRMGLMGDLELGTFVDFGQLDEDVRTFMPTGFAAGAGFGLRYNTPVGPFAIDFGWKVLDGARQLPPLTSLQRMNVHLSIGTF
jgi:outer membrane protein insertion porin family